MKSLLNSVIRSFQALWIFAGFCITAVLMTACSDTDQNEAVICEWPDYFEFFGSINYDNTVNRKVFISERGTSAASKGRVILLPDSLQWLPEDTVGLRVYFPIIKKDIGDKIYEIPSKIVVVQEGGVRSTSNSKAEYGCGTDDKKSNLDPIDWDKILKSRASSIDYLPIRVAYHAIYPSDASSVIDPNELAHQALQELNVYFNDFGISFVLTTVSSHQISNTKDNIDLNEVSLCSKIYSLDYRQDCLNLYEITEFTRENRFNTVGISQAIGSKGLIVLPENERFPTTIAHEVGHCLGLYHTHHGTDPNEGGSEIECADGSNGSTAGDFIPDTPADPNLWKDYTTYDYISRSA